MSLQENDSSHKTATLELEAPKLDNAGKRALIEMELQADPQRSDREIARVVSCDHKTVASVRGKISPPTAPENSPPETAQQVADSAVARGIAKLAASTQDNPDEFDWNAPDEDSIVLREQRATALYFNRFDELVIRQQNWPDEDAIIYIGSAFHQEFIDRLTDILGIVSAGGPKPTDRRG